jgi:Protein of unknown function (DUF3455)
MRIRRLIRFDRVLPAAVLAAMAALALVALAHAGPRPRSVPGQLKVRDANKVFLIGHGVGVQIYACSGAGVWSFVAPRASLYGDNGKLIISHFGGPTWQAKDGSRAVGTLVDKAIVDGKAIPWLLLSARTSAGPDGDRLVDTTLIQRVNTTGGLAPPAAGCNAAAAGAVVEVPYTSDYIFWKKTGA